MAVGIGTCPSPSARALAGRTGASQARRGRPTSGTRREACTTSLARRSLRPTRATSAASVARGPRTAGVEATTARPVQAGTTTGTGTGLCSRLADASVANARSHPAHAASPANAYEGPEAPRSGRQAPRATRPSCSTAPCAKSGHQAHATPVGTP